MTGILRINVKKPCAGLKREEQRLGEVRRVLPGQHLDTCKTAEEQIPVVQA